MVAVGSHRGCVVLREARQRAGCRGAQTRQLYLPRGSRHPDVARGIEQRTLLAQAQRRSPDQMRGVSRGERWPRVEREVLSSGHSFEAPFHLQGSLRDFATSFPLPLLPQRRRGPG